MKKMSEVRQQMEKNATPDEGLSKQTELVQDEKNGGESVEKNKFPTSLERICLSPVVNHVFHNFSIQKVLNVKYKIRFLFMITFCLVEGGIIFEFREKLQKY
jgi:hypothetical protein